MSSHKVRPERGAGMRIALALALLGAGLGGCSTISGTWNGLFTSKPMAGEKDATPAEAPRELSNIGTQVQTQPELPSFSKNAAPVGPTGERLMVNSFLWHAALDTVSFMPLVSADPYGGVIITDWYSPPETPKERFKLNVYVLGRDLRAEGIKVSIFRERESDGQWQEAAADKLTATDLEDTILTRAQRLRSQTIGQ
jgi:hypothetical protein